MSNVVTDQLLKSIIDCQTPEGLEAYAEELNQLVIPGSKSDQCKLELRNAALRDFWVELLWLCKETELNPPEIDSMIQFSRETFQKLLSNPDSESSNSPSDCPSNSLISVTKNILKKFSPITNNPKDSNRASPKSSSAGSATPSSGNRNYDAIGNFFAETLVQHHQLWRHVLLYNREKKVICREVNITSLPLDNNIEMPLNMALPVEYLNPPIEENQEEVNENGTTGENVVESVPIGASVSRICSAFDRVANPIIEEMKIEMENLISKNEIEMRKQYLKT